VEYAQFKSIFKDVTMTHLSKVGTAPCKRWERSSVASKLLELFSLSKPSSEGLIAFLTRCTNLYCELQAAGFLNEGMFVYVTRVLKEDPKYAVWVDIVRSKGQLPQFRELSDQAREFFAAAEISSEREEKTIEGAPHMKKNDSVKCDYCGFLGHK
jgi:hypothetical protein